MCCEGQLFSLVCFKEFIQNCLKNIFFLYAFRLLVFLHMIHDSVNQTSWHSKTSTPWYNHMPFNRETLTSILRKPSDTVMISFPLKMLNFKNPPKHATRSKWTERSLSAIVNHLHLFLRQRGMFLMESSPYINSPKRTTVLYLFLHALL